MVTAKKRPAPKARPKARPRPRARATTGKKPPPPAGKKGGGGKAGIIGLLGLLGLGAFVLLKGTGEAARNGDGQNGSDGQNGDAPPSPWPLGALGSESGELLARGVPCQSGDLGTQWATANVPELTDGRGRYIYTPGVAPALLSSRLQFHWLVQNIGDKPAKIKIPWCRTVFGFTTCLSSSSQREVQPGEIIWIDGFRTYDNFDFNFAPQMISLSAEACPTGKQAGAGQSNWNPPGVLFLGKATNFVAPPPEIILPVQGIRTRFNLR